MLPAIPAVVIPATVIPISENPQVAELQRRAERHVLYMEDGEVEIYEIDRALTRAELKYPPVPVTNRGLRVLNARQYTVSPDGHLSLH